MIKTLTALLLCAFASFSVHAADRACEAKAAEKKLAGAAKASFLKKCEKDAVSTDSMPKCEAQAMEKNLRGAAKARFMQKCEKDAAAAAK